jgi:predicted metal-dependent phosphoesterase TrpH
MYNSDGRARWSRVDLHVHTNASDGTDDPDDVVALAARRGIEVIAVVDHDTTAGLDEATTAGCNLGVVVVPGIELSTEEDGHEVHLLGLFVDQQDPRLQDELARQRTARSHRAQMMVAKLTRLGFSISWKRVVEIAGHSAIGRPHIAQALVEQDYVPSTAVAMETVIGPMGPAYIARPQKLTPIEGIALLRAGGAIPILAHPLVMSASVPTRWSFPQCARLEDYRRAGLLGLEAYYTGYPQVLSYCLCAVAEHHGLIVTGGSDYHGSVKPSCQLGGVQVPVSCALELSDLACREGCLLRTYSIPIGAQQSSVAPRHLWTAMNLA